MKIGVDSALCGQLIGKSMKKAMETKKLLLSVRNHNFISFKFVSVISLISAAGLLTTISLISAINFAIANFPHSLAML